MKRGQMGALAGAALSAVVAVVMIGTLAGCGSGRISVDGYTDADLNQKRVFVLLPKSDKIMLANPAAFAASRGVAEMTASERIGRELQSDFQVALDGRLDSNTVLEYGSQSVGATIPMDPAADFPAGAEARWDWSKAKQAAKQGNIDYLLVLHSVRVENEMPTGGEKPRGKEKITATFSLIDPLNEKLMTGATVDAEIDDPRRPVDTYVKLSKSMAKKLPFHIRQD